MAEANGNRNTPPPKETKDQNHSKETAESSSERGSSNGPGEKKTLPGSKGNKAHQIPKPTDGEILQDIKDQIRTEQEECLKIRNMTKEKTKELKDLEGKIARNKTIHDQTSKELNTLRKQLQDTQQTHNVLSNEIRELKKTHELNISLQTMMDSQSRKIEKNKKEITELSSKCDQLEKHLKIKTDKLNEVTKEFKTKTGQHDLYKSQMESAFKKVNESLQAQQRNVIERETTIETLHSEVSMLQGNVAQLQIEGQQYKEAYESEMFHHNNTKADLESCKVDLARKNVTLQSNEKELEFLQNEVSQARIETRELHIRYCELPEKEGQFERIELNNKQLREENVILQEQLRETSRLQSLISILREQTQSLSNDKEKLEAYNKKNADRYRQQVYDYGQQTDDLVTIRRELVKYKQRVHQNTNEVECLRRKLQEAYGNVEGLKQDLFISQSELLNTKAQLEEVLNREKGDT